MAMRNSFAAKFYYRWLEHAVFPLLKRHHLQPNQVTLIGSLLAALAPVGFWFHPWAGGLAILISGLADSLDGLLARKMQKATRLGAFMDSCMDRIADFFYLMGFWLLFWPDHQPLAAGMFVMATMASTFLISYAKARAESLGLNVQTGPMERAGRIIFLVIWSILLGILPGQRQSLLWSGIIIYLAATTFTAAIRIIKVKIP